MRWCSRVRRHSSESSTRGLTHTRRATRRFRLSGVRCEDGVRKVKRVHTRENDTRPFLLVRRARGVSVRGKRSCHELIYLFMIDTTMPQTHVTSRHTTQPTCTWGSTAFFEQHTPHARASIISFVRASSFSPAYPPPRRPYGDSSICRPPCLRAPAPERAVQQAPAHAS